MLFSSFTFIAIYLPLVVYSFFLCPKYLGENSSKIFLILASLFFYAYWNPIYLPLLLCSILFNYVISNKIRSKKSKPLLWTGITSNILLLGYFKYMDFFIENINFLLATEWPLLKIILPLGISFFTFQQIAYLIDSHHAKTDRHSFLDYSLFVAFFPQLIAGPIVHWKEMMPQFSDINRHCFNADNFLKGTNIFILGFFKKILIADNLAYLSDAIFNDTSSLDLVNSWLGGICFMFQIYFDFSAYSDMAIGIALMMNIKLPVNFNSPYKARNINDFWNRWHITLTRWFFQYMFIPITAFLTKKRNTQTGMNLFVLTQVILIVFFLSGLWHGAAWTFIIWGTMHGLALVAYRLWQASHLSMHKYIAKTLTVIFLIIAAVVFRSSDLEILGNFIFAMTGGYGFLNPDSNITNNSLIIYTILIVPAYIIFFMPNVLEIVGYERIKQDLSAHYVAPFLKVKTNIFSINTNILVSITYAMVFSLTLIKVMTANSPEAFIYFDF